MRRESSVRGHLATKSLQSQRGRGAVSMLQAGDGGPSRVPRCAPPAHSPHTTRAVRPWLCDALARAGARVCSRIPVTQSTQPPSRRLLTPAPPRTQPAPVLPRPRTSAQAATQRRLLRAPTAAAAPSVVARRHISLRAKVGGPRPQTPGRRTPSRGDRACALTPTRAAAPARPYATVPSLRPRARPAPTRVAAACTATHSRPPAASVVWAHRRLGICTLA